MESENKYIKSEAINIEEELFKKKIADEAEPYLKEILGNDEAQELVGRLIEVFKRTEGEGDFENRVNITLHDITHPLAIQIESKREKIANVLYRIASERLLATVKNMIDSEKGNGTDKVIPFSKE